MNLKLLAATAAFSLAGAAAQAVVIDFESDTTGPKANGFQSVDSAIVSFSDTIGSNLSLFDFPESDGVGLGVFTDDESQLQMDFSQTVSNLSLDFGNDDPRFIAADGLAILEGWLNGVMVGMSQVVVNRNDLMDQSISFLGTIDQAFFYYADANGDPEALIEIVDNISFDVAPIPLPAGALLLLTGLGGFAVARRRA